MATISNKTASTSIFSFCTNTLLLFIQNISIFYFIFSSLVSVHIMVYNYTSFYYFWCRNINRSRNSLVWNCCYSNLPQVCLEELSALTREDSNGNNFKQDCFYLYFSFCTKTLLLFIQNISIFDFIFSSLVSVHIMVYNYTCFYVYFWCRNINRSRNSLVWRLLLFQSSKSGFGRVICSYRGRFELQQFQTRLLLPLFQFLHQHFNLIHAKYFKFLISSSLL